MFTLHSTRDHIVYENNHHLPLCLPTPRMPCFPQSLQYKRWVNKLSLNAFKWSRNDQADEIWALPQSRSLQGVYLSLFRVQCTALHELSSGSGLLLNTVRDNSGTEQDAAWASSRSTNTSVRDTSTFEWIWNGGGGLLGLIMGSRWRGWMLCMAGDLIKRFHKMSSTGFNRYVWRFGAYLRASPKTILRV